MKPREIKISGAMLALMEEHRVGRDELARILAMVEDEPAAKQLDLLDAVRPAPEVKAAPASPVTKRVAQVVELARANGGRIHYEEVMRLLGITRGAATGALSSARKAGLMKQVGGGVSEIPEMTSEPPARPYQVGALEALTWIEGRANQRAHFREVADALGCKPERANNLLLALTAKGHLVRVSRGTYWAMPR